MIAQPAGSKPVAILASLPGEIQEVKDVVKELKFISFNLNVDIRAYVGISMGYLGSEEKIWKI